MRILTKDWVKDIELHDLIIMLESNSNKKMPFVFTNGGTESIAKEDLYTLKTNLNVTEKENEINYVMLPDTFDFKIGLFEDDKSIKEATYREQFLLQYVNRLRVITYLPDSILKSVKDKRLLALGYAETETKKEILKYAKKKFQKAFDVYEKCSEASVEAEQGLTAHGQFEQHRYLHSIPFLFDGVTITKSKE